jgi:hypothetical protein
MVDRAEAAVTAVKSADPMPVAPRLVRAEAALFAPVPPCVTGKIPAKVTAVVAGTMVVPSQYNMLVDACVTRVDDPLPDACRLRVNAPVVELFTQYCCTVAGTTMVTLDTSVPVNLYAIRFSSEPLSVYVPPVTAIVV